MKCVNRLIFFVACVLGLLSFKAVADDFVISHIKIEGLQRITPDTVKSYLPIQPGETYTDTKGPEILKSLYETGFFSHVELSREESALVIQVTERPVISLIHFHGNKELKSDKLRPILKKMGIAEGEAFNSEKVNEIVLGLKEQYSSMGYNAAQVTTQVTKEPHNTVGLTINVQEGPITKVGRIRILGNHAFTEAKLLQQFQLTPVGLFTWISHRDRYSETALQRDLQKLAEFYMNHGYLRFQVVSQQVTLNTARTRVAITINVDEGPVYHIGTFTVSGDTYGYRDFLMKLIRLKPGDVFDRQRVIDFNKVIGDYLSNRGYAFTTVNVIPAIDENQKLVNVDFNVTPGPRIYVRRVNFFGNQRTDQVVLRREMRQFEGGTYSLAKIEESKRRLQLLSYFDDVSYRLEPVPGLTDQVDLNWNVHETAAGRASLQAGYSDLFGFTYGANLSEPNFLGTGKYVALGFQNNQYQDYYSFQYFNPYYTLSGISRGFTVYYSHIKPSPKFNIQSYTMDGYGLSVNYGYPVSERSSLGFGYGYENVNISQVNGAIAAPSVVAFLNDNPTKKGTLDADYNQFKISGGWNYNGLDRIVMPTSGGYSSASVELGAPIIKSSIGYYSISYTGKYYQPLFAGFIFNVSTTLAFGNQFSGSLLPFYKNFYAGGIGSVPAFAPNSLGPKNRYNSNAAIGGNLETIVGAHLILPSFTPSVRTAIIFDAGNVFQVPRYPGDIAVPARGLPSSVPGAANNPDNSGLPQIIQDVTFRLSNLRYSLGIGLDWKSPMGPLSMTLAYPLNKQAGDQLQAFQFSMGLSL